jgi:deazaflavin-dependent oxidoreductase (nitroreductase family)
MSRAEVGPVAALVRRLGHRRWFIRLARAYVPVDRLVARLSRGRLVAMGLRSLPFFLLTTVGRRSGSPRTVPLLYLPDDPDFVVIGSNFGQTHHPAWSSNLLANPAATVNLRGQPIQVQARLVLGDERDALITRLREMWPAYATYETTAARTLRVFRLERVPPEVSQP